MKDLEREHRKVKGTLTKVSLDATSKKALCRGVERCCCLLCTGDVGDRGSSDGETHWGRGQRVEVLER